MSAQEAFDLKYDPKETIAVDKRGDRTQRLKNAYLDSTAIVSLGSYFKSKGSCADTANLLFSW